MSKHRCFEVTTPEGHTARIHGDPEMSQATLEALMHMMDLACQQLSAIEITNVSQSSGDEPSVPSKCAVCGIAVQQLTKGRRRKYCPACVTQLRHRTPVTQARKSGAENV